MDEVEINRLEGVIEAVLFTMGESVELEKIAAAIGHDKDTTRKIIHRMMDKYEAEDRGIRVIELEDAFQMCTKKETYEYLIRVAKQPKKYVLKSDHAVNKLVEYNLVCECGRLDAPGKPILFGTTEEFLRRFSVQSVDDLPSLNAEQMESFKEEAEEEVQLKLDI